MSSDVPAFNLKAVVRETGLKPDTIRAWERRYGVPKPQRTPGGHRLYSQHDIDLLKWMTARQHEGLSISRIVDMWKALEAEGEDPLEATAYNLTKSVPLGEVGELANLRRDWVNACTQFDEGRAEQAVMQAFALFPLESVVTDLLLHGLSEVGEGWYRGEVSVQQEHFASTLVMRRLNTLIASSPTPTHSERLVLFCPPDEQHMISLQVINLLLRRQGWNVVDLGANVPLDRLEQMLTSIRPQLVITSAQHLPTAYTLKMTAEMVTRLHIPFAFGGGVFNRHPKLSQYITGHFLGEDLSAVPHVVREILSAPWPLPRIVETPKDCLTAAQHYREQQAAIEADVMARLAQKTYEAVMQSGANAYLAQYVTVALRLGNLEFLNIDLAWIRGLLAAYQVPVEVMSPYLQSYAVAAQRHLDRRGQMIVDWFKQVLVNLAEGPAESASSTKKGLL